jgi:hypothetical protein
MSHHIVSLVAMITASLGCTAKVGTDIANDPRADAGPAAVDAPGGGSTTTDANTDAPGAMVTVTLSQTTNNYTFDANSMGCAGCNNTSNPCNNQFTEEQTYYRVFTLADHGITNAFHVTQITFVSQSAAGSPVVTVKLGTYAATLGGTLNTGTTDFAGAVTMLKQTTVTAPTTVQQGVGIPVAVPITADVPANSNLIVALATPNYTGQSNKYFFIGGTNSGETKPAYVRSSACGATLAATTASVGFPQGSVVISVTGSH